MEKSKIQNNFFFNYDFGSIEINGGIDLNFFKENIQYEYEEFGDTSIDRII